MSRLIWDMNWFLGRLRRIFFMALPESEADYEKSRRYYIAGDSAAQTINQLAGGSFLVSLMLFVGFSDSQIGILTSFASLAALFQLFTMQRINRLKKRKLFVCLSILMKVFLALIFFIPLFSAGNVQKQVMVIACYFFGQICMQVASPATQDWLATLVPIHLRGNYFAKKDAIAVFVTVTVMLIAGVIMDVTEGERQILGFVINGSLILFLSLFNFWAFCCMKEPRVSHLNPEGKEIHGKLVKKYREADPPRQKGVMLHEMKGALQDSDFRIAFITTLLWQTAWYVAAPFNTSYQLKELGLSFTFLMVISFVGNMLRIAITPAVGRLGDRFGMAFVYKYSLVGILMYFAMYVMAVPSNAVIVTIFATLFSGLGWSFASIGLFGVQLEMISEEKRTIQLSIISSVAGIYGFLVSLISGNFLDWLQRAGLTLAGRPIYAQQITNALGALFLLVLILYQKFVVQKRERELRR